MKFKCGDVHRCLIKDKCTVFNHAHFSSDTHLHQSTSPSSTQRFQYTHINQKTILYIKAYQGLPVTFIDVMCKTANSWEVFPSKKCDPGTSAPEHRAHVHPVTNLQHSNFTKSFKFYPLYSPTI